MMIPARVQQTHSLRRPRRKAAATASFSVASICWAASPPMPKATAALLVEWQRDGRRVEALWKLQGQGDGNSIRVTSLVGAEQRVFDLLVPGVTGRVVDMVARAHHVRDDWHMVVLGIASLNSAGDALEYRMLVQHVFEPVLGDRWMHTTPLLTRPPDQPFDGMSISFPGATRLYSACTI